MNLADVTSFTSLRDNIASATGGSYVEFQSTDQAYIEFTVNVSQAGEYLVSFRYATDLSMRFLSVFVNDIEVTRDLVNQVIQATLQDPPSLNLLSRCQGNCNQDYDCALGLICSNNAAYSGKVPGCSVSGGDTNSYCVDPNDFSYGALLYPTGDDRFRMNLNNGKSC